MFQRPTAVKRDGKVHVRQQWVRSDPTGGQSSESLMGLKNIPSSMGMAVDFGEELIRHGHVGVTVFPSDQENSYEITVDGTTHTVDVTDQGVRIGETDYEVHEAAAEFNRIAFGHQREHRTLQHT